MVRLLARGRPRKLYFKDNKHHPDLGGDGNMKRVSSEKINR